MARSSELSLIDNDFEDQALDHELQTAPLVTYDARENAAGLFPQVSTLGRIIEQSAPGFDAYPDDPRLYLNTRTPLSGLICGVQGSGKSHTSSVLLENFLLQDGSLGTSAGGLAGLVFHFDTNAGGGAAAPSEAAYLAKGSLGKGPKAKVTVLVSPTNLKPMRRIYAHLPVDVQPLHFSSEDITATRMLAMMVAGDKRPLYIEKVMSILRARPADEFNYQRFRKEVEKGDWDSLQKRALSQRLDILDGFLQGGKKFNRVANHFEAGRLTIIDLSDPFYDPVSCSGIFDLVLGMFDQADVGGRGKFILLDEAHKYLTAEARLTSSILSLIRQQRHRGMRVLISTQEPTVVEPTVLDLVSFIIIHRFSSPSWAAHLDKHVRFSSSNDQEWFTLASRLHTGEALVFAPASVGLKQDEGTDYNGTDLLFSELGTSRPKSDHQTAPISKVATIGSGYFRIKTRRRLTRDGGSSVLSAGSSLAPSNSEYWS